MGDISSNSQSEQVLFKVPLTRYLVTIMSKLIDAQTYDDPAYDE